MKMKGIGASSGIAYAKVFELKEVEVKITDTKTKDTEGEIKAVENAIAKSVTQIKNIKKKAMENLGEKEAAIFDAHIQVASDPSLLDGIKDEINNNSDNALFASKKVTDNFATMFENMEDEYMKERAADVKDVAKRIINNLAGVLSTDVSTIDKEVIIVAEDLTPSDTAMLDKKYVKGFITDIGGRTSHAAIMARSLEIPAVLGLKDVTSKVETNDMIALDGDTGEVIINPTKSEMKEIDERKAKLAKEKAENLKYKGRKSISKDGKHVELAANIGSPNDIEGIITNDGEGVGLFRSEFLYMDANDWPTEDEQYKAYKAVLEGLPGKRIIVRTLDIGGDKKLTYYKFPEELNPFLGYRAIRFCLDNKEVFKTQLRALLRASVHGKLAIMFPMIATIDELLAAKKVLADCKKELIKKGVKVSDKIEVGIMVEIPSTAVLSNQFAKHVDFFSIGTNDLMQYTMAADRMSEKVAYLYQPLNPAILNMINMTIQGAHNNGKWVGMCGEMAGDPNAIPFLLGMGLDEFSMSASSILAARRQIANIDSKDAKLLANKALSSETEEDVKKILNDFNSRK